jgi:hypothetical protein
MVPCSASDDGHLRSGRVWSDISDGWVLQRGAPPTIAKELPVPHSSKGEGWLGS